MDNIYVRELKNGGPTFCLYVCFFLGRKNKYGNGQHEAQPTEAKGYEFDLMPHEQKKK